MARTKGMLNLSGNLEVNAQAPLDARTVVPTEADLTVASNFPYPYVGLEVYVTGTGKKFRLVNLDTTQSSSWHEVGEGGGGSGLPSGGTQGQYLVKQSLTEGDADWQTLSAFSGATSQSAGSAGLVPAPSAGDEGKVLFGNGAWGNIVMPSVDYSVSNEANILSTTEKVVGMWVNRKLIYSKTVYVGALPNKTTTHTPHGISDIDEIVQCYGIKQYGHIGEPIPNNEPSDNSWAINLSITDTEIQIRSGQDQSPFRGYMFILYTKTTDSPLASDVKFAGLLSDGSVVYKKTVATGGSVPSGATLIYRLPLLNSTDVVYFTR